MSLIYPPSHQFDQEGTLIQIITTADDQGESVETDGLSYTVRFKWLSTYRGNENQEAGRAVATQRRSALIRAEDRTITPENHKLTHASQDWYVESVRPYTQSGKTARNLLVLDLIMNDR